MLTVTQPHTSEMAMALQTYDPSDGTAVPCLVIDDRTVIGVMPVAQVLDLVPDPIAAEDPRRTAEDPDLRDYAELRREVQRAVEGSKRKNAYSYRDYLHGGIKGRHPWMVPPITLWHETPLQIVRVSDTTPTALLIPWGDHLVTIDGETQRIAWQLAAGLEANIKSRRIGVVVHHGKSVTEARQGFYDLNTKEVKPNIAVAIAMDTQDVATRITRTVIDNSDVIRGAVHLTRRQLRRTDREKLTISALRTGIVTTILGAPGLQVGSRSVSLGEGVSAEALEAAVVQLWTGILDLLTDELEPDNRQTSVASAPAVLAGIGILAHHAMPSPPRAPEVASWCADEILDRLEGVNWFREYKLDDGRIVSPWEGIAGKRVPTGRFAVGGPKEVGNAVAQALEHPQSPGGEQVRQWAGQVLEQRQGSPAKVPPAAQLLAAVFRRVADREISVEAFYDLAHRAGYTDRRGLGGFFSREGRSLERVSSSAVRLTQEGIRTAQWFIQQYGEPSL